MIVGGAQQNTMFSCALVDPDRFKSILVTGPETGSEGSLLDEVRERGIETVIVPELRRAIAPWHDLRATRAIRQVLRSTRPAIVHTHSSKAGVIGRMAAKSERVPGVVHTVHGWSFHDQMNPVVARAYQVIERRLARNTDRLVVVAGSDATKGLEHGIGTPAQYELIRSGFDLGPYSSPGRTAAEARAELGLAPDAFVIGSVGRLSEQKDPMTFIEMAALVAADTDNAQFVLVGDGPLRGAVLERAAALGIADKVFLTGVRSDVPDLLPGFDVFALSSRWEGLPRVIPQAMAAGLPVVATAVDGSVEALRDSGAGILVPPADPAAFAGAVLTLARDAALREKHAENGRQSAPEYSLATMIRQLEGVYTDLVAQ